MAEGQVGAAALSFMPPPDLYSIYTQQNIDNNTAPSPPPIPETGYTVFGIPFTTNGNDKLPWKALLEAENWQQLYPKENFDVKAELKKIAMSLLFNYMDLIKSLVDNPTEWRDHFTRIVILLQNFQTLLNEYRPHQARETLKSMMEAQRQRRQNTAKDIETFYNAINANLSQCLVDVFPKAESTLVEYQAQLAALEAEAHMWEKDE